MDVSEFPLNRLVVMPTLSDESSPHPHGCDSISVPKTDNALNVVEPANHLAVELRTLTRRVHRTTSSSQSEKVTTDHERTPNGQGCDVTGGIPLGSSSCS